MPIMDGYLATHTIRTQEPFKARAKDIPIVAMTASAIQGDKEKCQKAGMDDYLAKPVKGKVLEKMLLKWAVEGHRKAKEGGRHQSLSLDSEYGAEFLQQKDDSGAAPTELRQIQKGKATQRSKNDKSVISTDLESHLNRLVYQDTAALSGATETSDQRHTRGLETEEMASSLRDNKLLSACEDPRTPLQIASKTDKGEHRVEGPSHPLTLGNLGRHLSSQQKLGEAEMVRQEGGNMKKQASSSMRVNSWTLSPPTDTVVGKKESGEREFIFPPSPIRPESRRGESERTVTHLSPRTRPLQ